MVISVIKSCPRCGRSIELVKDGPFNSGRCFACDADVVQFDDESDRMDAIDVILNQIRGGERLPLEHVLMVYGVCFELLKDEIREMRKGYIDGHGTDKTDHRTTPQNGGHDGNQHGGPCRDRKNNS
jgi:endogenous inhibitor of DNA gyrase (YacG/DUF329 family)